jgi:site-specific recombinase XerD
MNWQEDVERYIDTRRSKSTKRAYSRALEKFQAWYKQTYGQNPDTTLITDQVAREWRAYLTSIKRYAASTVNIRLSALTGLARQRGTHLNIKFIKQVPKPVDVLTEHDVSKLLQSIKKNKWGPVWLPLRNTAMVSLMVRSGLRVGEVVSLDIQDIDLWDHGGRATIREGKGLKERSVPLSLQCRKDLTAYLEKRPSAVCIAVFLGSRRQERLSTRSVQQMVSRAATRAGITRNCTPHVLRHTFATRYLKHGGDIRSLQSILGHDDLETTARYLHPDAQQIQAMVERL